MVLASLVIYINIINNNNNNELLLWLSNGQFSISLMDSIFINWYSVKKCFSFSTLSTVSQRFAFHYQCEFRFSFNSTYYHMSL
jgi:hypothetical protein